MNTVVVLNLKDIEICEGYFSATKNICNFVQRKNVKEMLKKFPSILMFKVVYM